jgi:hypothetical protein
MATALPKALVQSAFPHAAPWADARVGPDGFFEHKLRQTPPPPRLPITDQGRNRRVRYCSIGIAHSDSDAISRSADDRSITGHYAGPYSSA